MNLSDYNWKQILATALLVAVVAPFVIYAVPQVIGASQAYVVLSDSMSPSIQGGDVVVVDGAQPGEIETGDVITYESPGGDQLVTHRVVELVQQDGQTELRTKGDANEEADQQLVAPSAVVGTVWFHIPWIGYVIQFGSSGLGTLLLVVVPAVLLAVNEIYELYTDATGGSEKAATSDAAESESGVAESQATEGSPGGED